MEKRLDYSLSFRRARRVPSWPGGSFPTRVKFSRDPVRQASTHLNQWHSANFLRRECVCTLFPYRIERGYNVAGDDAGLPRDEC